MHPSKGESYKTTVLSSYSSYCVRPPQQGTKWLIPKGKLGRRDALYVQPFFFFDDPQLFVKSDEVFKSMADETETFFWTVGLNMNIEKSATDSTSCVGDARLLEHHKGYKYLGTTENRVGKNMTETAKKIVKFIEAWVEPYINQISMAKFS